MAEELALIRDLAVIMVAAAATTILFQRVRLPVVLGYLVAGLLVGPNILPFSLILDPANIAVLAELGVLFILFTLGLEFHLGKLKRMGGLALTSGTLEIGIMIGVGILVANLFGWRSLDALFLGAILAISSTTIIVKVLEELGLRRSKAAEAIFGILLVEDLAAVVLIALLSSIALTGEFTLAAAGALGARIALFAVVALVLGLVVVPRLLDRVARFHLEETLLITSLGVAFLLSMVALALGLSLALGAFIAGAIVAESRASAMVERRIAPLRDTFVAIFFVSTGVLVSPADIVQYWLPILVLTAVSVIGKMSAVSLATFVAGYPPREAMRVGIGMALVGEFSFIIAGIGRDLGVTSSFLFPIVVSVSALTTFITPLLIRRSDAIVNLLARVIPEPLRDYGRTYTAWVGRRRAGEGGSFAGGWNTAALVRGAAYAALLAGLAFMGGFVVDGAVALWGPTLFVPGDTVVFGWAIVALLALPVVYGLVQTTRQAVREIVYIIVPPRLAEAAQGAAAAAVLRRTLYAFFAVLSAVVVFAVAGSFLPQLPLLAAAALLVGAAGYALWGSVRRLNEQVERAVDQVFTADAAPATRDQVLSLIRERSPWEVNIESVLIPPGSKAAHQRIRDIGLPQRTGASIVTHERHGSHSVNPSPDVRLRPGDAVGLMGDSEQVARAKALLLEEEEVHVAGRTAGEAEVRVEEIEIGAASPIAGLTLAGSRIRERTGASIVGLRREGMPILNPAPVTRLRPGDAVVVLGSPDQVEAARRLLSEGEEGPAPEL